ncbi:MAG: FmdB family zinc ribbon protein [Gemmatimonadales bacterium]
MPTYEYLCPNGHSFEKVLRMSEKPRVKCPSCGRVARRQISGGAALVFKGSGFYITDYGKDGKGARKPEVAESSSGESKPAGKPDAKPETKAASGTESKADTGSAPKPEKAPEKKAGE